MTSNREKAAADPTSSLPDQWVGVERLREVVADHHIDMSEELMEALGALLPAPPAPRTLADMTPEERAECQWMQCEVPGLDKTGLIIHVRRNGCNVLYREGDIEITTIHEVIPLPDLPRMEWPASALDERAPESATPRPEDVPVGEPWQVEVKCAAPIGYRNGPASTPWVIIRDEEPAADYCSDEDVTLIARLAPETAEQDTETVFDPAYIYTERVAERKIHSGLASLSAEYGPYRKDRLVPESAKQDDEKVLDPAYTYRDKDGDEWQHILGAWRWLDTAGDINGNYDTPPAEYGPYTRIEDTNE